MNKQRTLPYWQFVKLLFVGGCCLFLSACQSEINSPTSVPNQSSNPTITKMEFSFWVEIPENTPAGERIQLVLYDDVSGKNINPQVYDMVVVDHTHFGIVLHVDPGIVLKYGYRRISETDTVAEEFTTLGQPVDYRTAYVDGPGEVHDIVARWQDTPPITDSGRLTGQIFDADRGIPVSNLLVFIGGNVTQSNPDGTFLFPTIPVGEQQITILTPDGRYLPYKQKAQISEDADTQAVINVIPAPEIIVTFNLTVPVNTPQDTGLSIAGNVSQLGNTFLDLNGGITILNTKMPELSQIDTQAYSVSLKLYGGTYLRYKYTLGDAYWNTEQRSATQVFTRDIYLPMDQSEIILNDIVQSWSQAETEPITFTVTTPFHTPADNEIYIQFKTNQWMPPIPMVRAGENQWRFNLYSPLSEGQTLTYRYCRNGICGNAEGLAIDNTTHSIIYDGQTTVVNDEVTDWHLLSPRNFPITVLNNPVSPRNEDFFGGVMLASNYNLSWERQTIPGLLSINDLGSNTVIFTPQLVSVSEQEPYFSAILGQSQHQADLIYSIQSANAIGLRPLLFPSVNLHPPPRRLVATSRTRQPLVANLVGAIPQYGIGKRGSRPTTQY